MGKDAPTLAETEERMIYFICPTPCGRAGRFKKSTLIENFDPETPMPSLLNQVARWRGCKMAENTNPYDPWFLSGFRCRLHYDIAKMRPR